MNYTCQIPKVKMETFAVLRVQHREGAAFKEFPANSEAVM